MGTEMARRSVESAGFDCEIHRYQLVHFDNPDQWLRLPVWSESLTVIRGASVPLFRTTQSFTDHKRFVVSVRIKLP